MPQFNWTTTKIACLRSLWATELSIDEIGSEIGVSRGSVAGKAKRLGLAHRRPGVKPVVVAAIQRPTQPEWQDRLRMASEEHLADLNRHHEGQRYRDYHVPRESVPLRLSSPSYNFSLSGSPAAMVAG